MSNIGRSNEWKKGQVQICLSNMLKCDPNLYEHIMDTIGFAYWFNVLTIIAYKSMWSVEDAEEYLRTGKNPRK